jgi:hypothetical protein
MPKISAAAGASNEAANLTADAPAEDAAGVDVDGDGDVTGYETNTKDELVAELEDRGLAKSGNKPELIERLEQDDAEKAEAAEAEAAEVVVDVDEQNAPEGG